MGIAPIPTTTTTEAGTISGGKHGDATYTKTRSVDNGVTTVDATRIGASGRTINDVVTITQNADGSISRAATITRPNGKTVERDTTLSASQNGTRTISGTVTGANGAVDQISGTRSKVAGGVDTSVTLTNQAGLTASFNDVSSHSGSVTTSTITGTTFGGAQVAEQIIRTELTGYSGFNLSGNAVHAGPARWWAQ